MEKLRGFGWLIKQDECEGCLQDLALICPRAGLDKDDIHRMLDLYWGLLRKHGVTKSMLMAASEAWVMIPKKGKPRFFPDPGELYELCAEEARTRKKAVGGLMRALALVDGPPPAAAAEAPEAENIEQRLRDLARQMSTKGTSATLAPEAEAALKARPAGRPHTDAAELKAALAKRAGIPIEDLERLRPPTAA